MIDASRVQACLRLHATVLWCNTGGWTQLLGAQERCGLPALLSSPVLNTSTYYGIHSLALTDLPCCISTLFPAKDGQICISPVGYAGCKAPASTMTSRSVIASLSSRAYLPGLIPSSMLLPLPGKYMTLPDLERELAMSLAASMRLSSIRPGPATFVASEMSRADSLSPSARMTAALRSCTL